MSFTEKELEILAKVEEQNKALLADEKAVCTLQTKHRTGSFSSSLSNESSTEGIKTENSLPPSTRTSGTSTVSLPSLMVWNTSALPSSTSLHDQWAHVINNWDQLSKKRSMVSDLIVKGLPDEFRAVVWRLFTGSDGSDIKKLYEGYLELTSPVERAIRRDIARTFPKHDLFKEENGFGQESLFRVIKAYSLHDNEVGYCQGSGFIAGLLLMKLPEAEAFSVFAQLMENYQLREMYKPSMLQLGICMYQLENLLAEHLPDLHLHFLTYSMSPTLYASAWFLTLFSTILPIPMAIRVMDLFIAEGLPFIFKMSLALLKFSARNLLAVDMESMVAYLQNEGPTQWGRNAELIFQGAASVKLNTKKMKKMEKEYMQIRSKEREEQIELRRLRTENGLLLQRIARLDEECTSMADRLVQSQLVRAQEAETLLALRCELSMMRRSMARRVGSHSPQDNGIVSTKGSPGNTAGTESTLNNGSSHQLRVKSVDASESKPADISSSVRTKSGSSFGFSDQLSSNKNYDLTKLPLSVNQIRSLSSTFPLSASSARCTNGFGSDDWMLATLSRLQTDLASSRAGEIEARLGLLNLEGRYRTLQQTKSELATRLSDEIVMLNDELCNLKLREHDFMGRLHSLKERVADMESKWKVHMSHCKASVKSNGLLGQTDSSCGESARKLSDALLETHYLQEISELTQRVHQFTALNTVAEHRANRLEQRIQELQEAQSETESVERKLRLELKQAVQACAEIEAKHYADMIVWRTRVMELTTELAELRQCKLQMECRYEGLLATQSLEMPEISNGESARTLPEPYLDGSVESVPDGSTGICSLQSSTDQSTNSLHCSAPLTDHSVTAVWKDLPPTIMTDSIGPLEDICLVPDDPLITSIYMNTMQR